MRAEDSGRMRRKMDWKEKRRNHLLEPEAKPGVIKTGNKMRLWGHYRSGGGPTVTEKQEWIAFEECFEKNSHYWLSWVEPRLNLFTDPRNRLTELRSRISKAVQQPKNIKECLLLRVPATFCSFYEQVLQGIYVMQQFTPGKRQKRFQTHSACGKSPEFSLMKELFSTTKILHIYYFSFLFILYTLLYLKIICHRVDHNTFVSS